MFFHARRGHPLFLTLRHRSHRMPALHAEGRLSPRPPRREIRRGNPDVGAPRPSRRRLRYLPTRHPGAPRCGAYFIDLEFPAQPPDRPTEGARASASSKGAASGAQTRRRAPQPPPNSAISIPRRMRRASSTWSAFSDADVRRRCVTAHNQPRKAAPLEGSAAIFGQLLMPRPGSR